MPWQLDFPSQSQLEQYGVLPRLPSKRNFAANRTSLSISIVGGEDDQDDFTLSPFCSHSVLSFVHVHSAEEGGLFQIE